MWFWGTLLGLFAGAAMHGWSGAFWGGVIGLLAGLLLARQRLPAKETSKSGDLQEQLTHTQKALEDIHWRLQRLEKQSALPPSPLERAAMEAVQADTTLPEEIADLPESVVATAAFSVASVPSKSSNIESQIPMAAIDSVPTVAAQATIGTRFEVASLAGSESISPESQQHPSKPSAPPGPKVPGVVERMLEGNIVAKLGVVILFFGVGFLLKFAYERGMFPPGLRLLMVFAASAVMFMLGQRLLGKNRTYALILLGGAMGLLYLDVFFALRTFELIGAPLGFTLFAGLGVATIGLAVKFDARAFAALGLIGAFLAPILASTGSGNHVLLFSYYLLLNLVILGASWFKAWRELNFIGFLFTFAIALIWGASTYQREHFSTIEPFLVAFFLLYLAIPILFAQRQPPELKGLVDGTLVFGMPLSAAMLQAALTRGMDDYVLAWSAFGAALIYGGLAWVLWRRESMRLLAEAHLALSVVFGTAAPFFALQGYPTFAFWTLEGAAIFWMGCRQKSVLARAFALCLQLAAAGYFWWVTRHSSYVDPWWNDRIVGCGLIASASMLTAWFIHRFDQSISDTEQSLQGFVLSWGCVWLFSGFVMGAWQQWPVGETRIAAVLLFSATIFTGFERLGARFEWRLLRLTSRAHVALIGLLAVAWADMVSNPHPLSGNGIVAWPLTFITYFYVLHRQRNDGVEPADGWRYQSAWFLMLALATWEAIWRFAREDFGWVFAIGVAGLFAAGLRFRLRESSTAVNGVSLLRLSNIPLLWSLVWWFAGLFGEIEAHSLRVHHLAWQLAAAAFSILLFEVIGRMLAWTALRHTQVLLTLAMFIATLHLVAHESNPFEGAQFFAWLAAFIIVYAALARQERDGISWRASWQHAVLFNLAVFLVAWEVCWRADDAALPEAWRVAGVGVTIALGLAVATFGLARKIWPLGPHGATIRNGSILPLLAAALLWTIVANVGCSGSISPLPYLPLLNPLDVAQLAVLAASIWATRHVLGIENTGASLGAALLFMGAGFFWINAALLRTVHHWAGVPFELTALLHSVVAQSALSLLWTTTALVMMFASRKKLPPSRALWMAGAALLGAVLAKLFANDLGNTGTVARIISFIGVGVLLLVIGYVAPVPPSAQEKKS